MGKAQKIQKPLYLRKPRRKKSLKIYFFKGLIFKFRRLYRFRSHFTNFRARLFYSKLGLGQDTFKLFLRFRSNNIFCTLVDVFNKKTILNISSGKYKMNTSKKKLRYNTKMILKLFLKDISSYLKNKNNSFIIQIISPIKNRKQIIRFLREKLKKIKRKNLIIYLKVLKCFNGCRPKKKKRKKRRQLRIFK